MSEKDEAQAAANEYADTMTSRHGGVVGSHANPAWADIRDSYLSGLAKGREMERQRCAEICERVTFLHSALGAEIPNKEEWLSEKCAAAIRSGK